MSAHFVVGQQSLFPELDQRKRDGEGEGGERDIHRQREGGRNLVRGGRREGETETISPMHQPGQSRIH